jgi:hypothetical protein
MHIIPRLSSEESRLPFTNHQSFLTVHLGRGFAALCHSPSESCFFARIFLTENRHEYMYVFVYSLFFFGNRLVKHRVDSREGGF